MEIYEQNFTYRLYSSSSSKKTLFRLQQMCDRLLMYPLTSLLSYCILVFITSMTVILPTNKQRRCTYHSRLVGMQAGDLPYKNGLRSNPFAFIQRLIFVRKHLQLDFFLLQRDHARVIPTLIMHSVSSLCRFLH